MKNNEENREKLSREVVDSWDDDTLIGYAIDQLMEFYKTDDDKFDEDWKAIFEDAK